LDLPVLVREFVGLSFKVQCQTTKVDIHARQDWGSGLFLLAKKQINTSLNLTSMDFGYSIRFFV
jgi:hypothetical protein